MQKRVFQENYSANENVVTTYPDSQMMIHSEMHQRKISDKIPDKVSKQHH